MTVLGHTPAKRCAGQASADRLRDFCNRKWCGILALRAVWQGNSNHSWGFGHKKRGYAAQTHRINTRDFSISGLTTLK
jgi:hypothetical protein